MEELEKILWVAHSLFNRNLVTGSSGNISFRYQDIIYISKSGSCFGLLDKDSFAKIKLDGTIIEGKPSKEYPMHLKLYENEQVNCVIHTHSFYSTLISCIKNIDKHIDILFEYTPYLYMQTKGKIQVVDYAKPGSEELFKKMYQKVDINTNVYLLKNHGIFVSGENILKCFCLLEEFESSARILHTIENFSYNKIQ